MIEYNINYNCVIMMRHNKETASTTNQIEHGGFFNELESVPITAFDVIQLLQS